MDAYICIHGHFYQPPRENPWLEAIELQDSAAPYHDWNERITAECYAPNSVSRVLDEQNRIVKLVNNYSKISFNFGPTLLSWLEVKAPDVYGAILTADQESRKNFSGHGSAIAQAYNHMIMPLANKRDRATQILWGIRDFEKRFGRAPEGMWLPETAVDLETLELFVQFGLRFTILAPHQAARVRGLGESEWHEVHGDRIDTKRAYLQRLPSGKSIAIFFYDGPIARGVAFEGLLSNGEHFIERLIGAFSTERDGAQLVHVATDGESYGHHHRFGDMALAYVLDRIDARQIARLTNYGEFLAKHPPANEVDIVEKSSWSCAHGIDRWWSHCGCNAGSPPGWNQEWRTPVRNALDWLRDTITAPWESQAQTLLKEPWCARDAYIDIVNDRSASNIRSFMDRHAARPLNEAETATALKLLEMQRHAMLMYTSCGWFFNDLSGIETVQILQFAGRVIHLAESVFGRSLEKQFVRRLAAAKSNLPEQGSGSQIYARSVQPAKVDWKKIGAHYAVSTLFETYSNRATIYCYDTQLEDHQIFTAGRAKLSIGRVQLSSKITLESQRLNFGVLHLGDHNINGGVAKYQNDESYRSIVESAAEPFRRADLTGVIRVMERRFGESNYSLRSLFRDQQRSLVNTILAADLTEAESLYRRIYDSSAPIMRFLTDLAIPLPKEFSAAAEFVLSHNLRAALQQGSIDHKRVSRLLESAREEGVSLDVTPLEFAYRRSLESAATAFAAQPSLPVLQQFLDAVNLLEHLPFQANLWQVQNTFYALLNREYPKQRDAQRLGDDTAQRWVACFEDLGRILSVKVPGISG
jgi:alpha-amylase/alpha-mannosidase (GH57 family)